MNISKCISSIIGQLGLYNINLPFDDKIENIIQNIITTTTIPIYSEFVPWLKEDTVDLNALKMVDKSKYIYLLPGSLTMTPVKYVSDVSIVVNHFRGAYGTIAPTSGIMGTAQSIAVGQAAMMVVGKMRAEPTYEYLGFNKIRLYGFPKSLVTIKVACEHSENGESIPSSCYDSFMQLAMLDVKMFLYNNLKLYDNIATSFGTIQLRTEDYQSADSERNGLLDEWRNTFHLDNIDWIEWM